MLFFIDGKWLVFTQLETHCSSIKHK